MSNRNKVIVAAGIVILLFASVIAGYFVTNGMSPKTSAAIQENIEKSLSGKEYVKSVEVKTYANAEGQLDANAKATSAAVIITLTKTDSANVKEVMSLLPEQKITTLYSILNEDMEHFTNVTGFSDTQIHDTSIQNEIAASLKVREGYTGSYWQIAAGGADGSDDNKLRTQFVALKNEVTPIRETVDKVLTDKMDVLPVAKADISKGSFVQVAAVKGKMENYNTALDFSLKYADKTFKDSETVVVLGLGSDIRISYVTLAPTLTYEKMVAFAKELNVGEKLKVELAKPEPVATESAKPTDTAKPTTSSTPTATAKPTSSATPTK